MTEDISSSPQGNLPNEPHLKNPQIQQNQSNSAKSSHGRWTKEEHHRFIEGIKHFGKNWRKVEEFIGTRTGAQIRSHAQKHFNRIMKLGNSEGLETSRHKKSDELIDEEQEQAAQESKNFSAQSEHVTQTENASELPSKPQGNHHQQQQQVQQQHQAQIHQQQQNKQREQHEHGIIQNTNNSQNSYKLQPASMNLEMKNENDISNSESQEISKKKRDWSKILSEQEKMRELEQKITSKKENKSAQKQEYKDLSAQSKHNSNQRTFLAENLEDSIRNHQYKSNLDITDNKLSPSDFINQALLAMIFEPADIQAHLLAFYMAQANLQSLLQPLEEGTSNTKKKIKPSRAAPPAETELRSLNSSHSTALSTEEHHLNIGQAVNHFATHRAQPLKPSPLRSSTQTNQNRASINQTSTKTAETTQNIINNNSQKQYNKIDPLQQFSQSSTPANSSISDSELIHLFQQFIGSEHQPVIQQPTQMPQKSTQLSGISPADKQLFCSPQATYSQANILGNIPGCTIDNNMPVNSLQYDMLCNTLLAAITSQFDSPN